MADNVREARLMRDTFLAVITGVVALAVVSLVVVAVIGLGATGR